MAAWTALRPCSITGRAGPPVVAARVMRRAAIRWARMVSRRIASAAGPVTGAMVAASSSRLARTLLAGGDGHSDRCWVPVDVEGHALGWAARRAGAQIGPVAAPFDAQHVAQFQAGPGDRFADRVSEGGDERAGAVTDDDGGGELLAGQHGDGVRGDAGRRLAVGRVGQVEPQRDLDAEPGAAGPDDHEAVAGDEAEQVRDDGQQVGWVNRREAADDRAGWA